MQVISKYLKHAPKDISAEAFCKGVTAYVARKYKQSQIDWLTTHPEDRLTASCIVFSRVRRQLWMIGDCQCMVGDQCYDNPKPYEKEIAEQRAVIAKKMMESNQTTEKSLREEDLARKAIIPQLLEAMKGQNKDYAVVDGFHIPMEKVKIITLDFRPWTIVLASDGYPFLKKTLAESEKALAEQATRDPLNIDSFKATKGFTIGANSFDDRSYIRFNI